MEDEGTLTELYRASGVPYGGIYVDKEYLKMYDTIFGKEAIDKLKKEDMGENLTIIRSNPILCFINTKTAPDTKIL